MLVKTFVYALIALAVMVVFMWVTDSIANPLLLLCLWMGSIIWVYFDARRILGKMNGRPEIRSAGQWAILAFLFWGIFFFYYLIDRKSIQRRVAEFNAIPEEFRF